MDIGLPRGSRVSRMNREFGVGRCKQLHLEWISSEVLPYSTGHYIWSLVIGHDGRQYEKKSAYLYIYMYDWATVLYSRNWHTVNQQCFNLKKNRELRG